MHRDSIGKVRSFYKTESGIRWYCELRGKGETVVLIPSGEGDCGSFSAVADLLATKYQILTFDMPGFSRTSAPKHFGSVSGDQTAQQIVALLKALRIDRAVFYGCSSGGVFALSIGALYSECVKGVIVHEVAYAETRADGPLNQLGVLSDDEIPGSLAALFRENLNSNPIAWDALGMDFHDRLKANYVTWVRHYVAPAGGQKLVREYAPEELKKFPIAWTCGSLTEHSELIEFNQELAAKANVPLETLPCKHFPQVGIPEALADHIRNQGTAF